MAEFQVFFEAVDHAAPTIEQLTRLMTEATQKFGQAASQISEAGEKLNKKLGEVKPKAEEAEGAFGKMEKAANKLASQFVGFAGAAGVALLLKSSVSAAVEEEEALNRLAFAVEATGGSFEQSKHQIVAFANEQQTLTRFSDTDTFQAMGRLVRVTGDVNQSMQATRLVFGLASASGKDFNTVMDLLAPVLQGDTSRMRALKNEFGAFIGDADTGQEVIDALSKQFLGAAERQQGFGTALAKVKNAFSDFQETLGNAVIPVLDVLLNAVTFIIKGWEQLSVVVGVGTKTLAEGIKLGLGAVEDIANANFGNMEKRLEEFHAARIAAQNEALGKIAEIEEKHAKRNVELSQEQKTVQVKNSDDVQQKLDKRHNEQVRASEELKEKATENEIAVMEMKGQSFEAEIQRIEMEKEAKLRALGEVFDKTAKTDEDKANLAKARTAVEKASETELMLHRDIVMKAGLETAKQVNQAIAGSAASAVADMILEGKSFEKAFKDVLNTVLRTAIETFVRVAIEAALARSAAQSITGSAGALGALGAVGVFATVGKSLFKKFQHGGVVTEPTLGLIGEAGPEAVVPLSRAEILGNTVQLTIHQTNHFTVNGAGEEQVRAIMRRIAEFTRNGAAEGAELVKAVLTQSPRLQSEA
ncbi:MAG: hypothetical protein HY548_02605 [Elusimicrobia bacterium]|nr:hypothetical protein [Elusimicrobiota bacterium]